ncbi:MAG: DNA-protecting protein DprA [Ardenticatenia bacterium]|nr:DNA-protecting protein DprA [Ardenticatenia bacterium]
MTQRSPDDHEATGSASADPSDRTAEPQQAAAAASADPLLPYWVAFSHVPGIGPRRLEALIARGGDVEGAWRIADGLAARCLDQRSLASFLSNRRHVDPDAAMAALSKAGAQALLRGDPRYPPLLRQIDRAPQVLFIRGDAALLAVRSLAVVGTRQVTPYGQRATAHLVDDLAAAGVGIVSGAALGVDALAHRRALEAGAPTIAVLGCGIDRCYPRANRHLVADIIAQGAVVSELPPGVEPLKGNFPARNRIISGLALATLVVEAGQRSGALITAEFALSQGRDVFAVPGEIFQPQAEGSNRLLACGAGVATSALDILTSLDLSYVADQNSLRRQRPADPVEAAILDALQRCAMDTDSLARALRSPVALVARSLTLMELKGMVQPSAGLRWVALG